MPDYRSTWAFDFEEGILSGRHHALPTPKVPFVLTFTFKVCGCRFKDDAVVIGAIGLYRSYWAFDLKKVFCQDATMPSLRLRFRPS